LFIVSYVFVYSPYSIRQDKERFTKAEASLDEVYNQIVAKVGKPDEVKKDNNCAYANRVYGKGPLSCGTDILFVYSVNNEGSANSILTSVNNMFTGSRQNFSITYVPKIHSFSALKDRKDFQEVNEDLVEKLTKISCYLTYKYASYDNALLPISFLNNSQNIVVELGCGGPAKAEHFTVKN